MKTSKIFKAGILACSVLALAACTSREKEAEPGHGWGEAVFSLNLVNVGETDVTVQEEATGADGAPFYGFVTSDVTSKTDDVIAKEMKSISASWKILRTGKPDPVTVSGLRRAGIPYRYIMFGLTPDGRTYGTPVEVSFETKGEYKTGAMIVSYEGRDERKNHVFNVSGTNGGYYDIAVLTKENAAKFSSDKELLNALMEQPEKPIKGDGQVLFSNLALGEYVVYVYGVEEELVEGAYNPTLQYAKTSFVLDRDFDVTYASWLGNWKVARGSATDIWTIAAKEEGKTYSITGIEGHDWPVTAVYEEKTGSFTIAEQRNVATTQSSSGETVSLGLYAMFNYQDGKTYYFGVEGYPFLRAELTAEDSATITGLDLIDEDGSMTDEPGYNFGDADYFIFYGSVAGTVKYQFVDSNGPTALPNALAKTNETPGPGPGDSAYNDFLGTWKDAAGNEYTISEKVADKSYTLSGFGVDVELGYNNGKLEVYAQSVGNLSVSGATLPGFLLGVDSDDYLEDAEQNTPQYLLATGTVSNGVISLTGQQYKATYSGTVYDEVIVALGIYVYDEQGALGEAGYYHGVSELLNLPGTLSKDGSGEDPNPQGAYEKWLGTWTLTKGSATETWTFTQKEANKSYYVAGLDGLTEYPFVATFDEESGVITIDVQDAVATDLSTQLSDGSTFTGNLGVYGNIEMGGKIYYVTGEYTIATGKLSADGKQATLTPGSVSISGYGDFTLCGLRYYLTNASGALSFTSTSTNLPNTMKKEGGSGDDPGTDPGDADYNSFIGTWKDAAGNEYTISQKVANQTYTLSGFGTDVELEYNNGKLEVYAQGVGDVTVSGTTLPCFLLGVDSDDYLEDAEQNTPQYLLATGSINNGRISLTGQQYKATYSGTVYDEVIVAFGLYVYDENGAIGQAGYYHGVSELIELPGVLSKDGDDPGTPDPDQAYAQWLGNWTVTKGSGTEVWTITQNVVNKNYYVAGVDGFDDYPFVANYDASTGGFAFKAQDDLGTGLSVELSDGSTFTGDLGLYGNIIYNDKRYYVTGGYTIATATMGKDGKGTLSGGTVNISGIGQLDLVSFGYFLTNNDGAVSFTSDFTALPNTMVKAANGAPATKASALSSWNAFGFADGLRKGSMRRSNTEVMAPAASRFEQVLSVAVCDKQQKGDAKKVARKRGNGSSNGKSNGNVNTQRAERTIQKEQRHQSATTSGTKVGKSN